MKRLRPIMKRRSLSHGEAFIGAAERNKEYIFEHLTEIFLALQQF